jgi:hypothetical protein
MRKILRPLDIKKLEGGFGGTQDRIDLIIPPRKIGNISVGSIGLVSISVLKVGCSTDLEQSNL